MSRMRCLVIAAMLFAVLPAASRELPLADARIDLGDRASLQRGARLYADYCAGCHSLGYLRRSRMQADLGLDAATVQAGFGAPDVKSDGTLRSAMPAEAAARWLGTAPPDLSLVARSRGADWVYTYLDTFYPDAGRPSGWNNLLAPDTLMPHPLWELQGERRPQYGPPEAPATARPVTGLASARGGRLDQAAYERTVRDITAFLAYAADPSSLQRRRLAPWVILFLLAFTGLVWLLKREYWKDVRQG